MRDLHEVMADVLQDVRSSNKEGQLSAHLRELEFSSLTVPSLPEDFVSTAVQLLREEAFLRLHDSWMLVGFLNNNWGQLEPEHAGQLRPLLVQAFDRFGDFMGAFVTAEVLGERYCDEESLAEFRGLSRTARDPARALVPHGLEYLARATRDDGLRERSVAALEELAKSNHAEVRREAVISLGKVKRH